MMDIIQPEDSNCRLPLDHLVSVTSDGAAVMISQKGGVIAMFKSINP